MTTREVVTCDVCGLEEDKADLLRSGRKHGHMGLYTYGERKGYNSDERIGRGNWDLCDGCVIKVMAALDLDDES